jgi:hypothetical protein
MNANSAAAASFDSMDLDCLRAFEVATPTLVQARALQRRIDRKYLLAANDVAPLLHRLQSHHLLLRAGRDAWARYDNLYFDSPERELYHAHRRGCRPRYKVRIRHHLDRQLTFLEIKRKENSGRTVKMRLPMPYGHSQLGSRERRFIETQTPIDAARLAPTLAISFLRLTLVGSAINERVTLDRQLEFSAGCQTRQVSRVVLAEVKQSQYANHDGAVRALRDLHAGAEPISKYCVGMAMLVPERANVFKPTLRAILRLS